MKQETPKTFKELFANTGIEPKTDENGNIQYNFKATMKEEPKPETLEEAADKFVKDWFLTGDKTTEVFKAGAKWQAERMYSEEEVLGILFKHTEYFNGYGKRMTLTEWFEQNKKK